MNLQYRIDLLSRLGQYILSEEESWLQAKEKAAVENGWFIPEFVDKAAKNIGLSFLQPAVLKDWASRYQLPPENESPRLVGILMAGNIPLVGFHDWLCAFISGHKTLIKASSKDQVLIKHLLEKLGEWEPAVTAQHSFSEMLKGCDAYIATGSNNSSRYFEYYFNKYPHIIRRNRTSVAIITGNETPEELEALADDVYLYFGLGCRNVTKLYVPEGYDFLPLLQAFKKYSYLADHHKYKNNYDYNLAILLLNKKYYMTEGTILLVEDPSFFSPISQLNYEFFSDSDKLTEDLLNHSDLQCLVGKAFIPFGKGQSPRIDDYADGVDTLEFLSKL